MHTVLISSSSSVSLVSTWPHRHEACARRTWTPLLNKGRFARFCAAPQCSPSARPLDGTSTRAVSADSCGFQNDLHEVHLARLSRAGYATHLFGISTKPVLPNVDPRAPWYLCAGGRRICAFLGAWQPPFSRKSAFEPHRLRRCGTVP